MIDGPKPRIVLSGVNLVEAGPLSVFQDALAALARDFLDRYEVIALVHRREFFNVPGIRYIEFPRIKSSWLLRIWFEYRSCKALSIQLEPLLWLAMHDMTPNVQAQKQAVYCHNPSPFYKPTLREAWTSWTVALFSVFYWRLYAIHIRRNAFVIVQQQWLRDEFSSLCPACQIIVAHPSAPRLPKLERSEPRAADVPCIFLYPAFPRVFKNIELLLEAAEILTSRQAKPFEIWITTDGAENSYARKLQRGFGHLDSVRWLGFQPRSEMPTRYANADCLVFMSRLETWGMPISEFAQTGKQMIVADLPYAHETVGSYDRVQFCPPDNAARLANLMEAFVNDRLENIPVKALPVPDPFANNWTELFHLLLDEQAPQAHPPSDFA